MLGIVFADAGTLSPGASIPAKPAPTVNSPTSYPMLSDLWNGNAYFEKTQYIVNPSILLDEAAPFPNPGTAGTGPNTVYTYYRSHNAPHDGIGLAISNDGGATYSLYNNGVPVVPANPNSNAKRCESWVNLLHGLRRRVDTDPIKLHFMLHLLLDFWRYWVSYVHRWNKLAEV